MDLLKRIQKPGRMTHILSSKLWSWFLPAFVAGVAMLIGFYFRPTREERFDTHIKAAAQRYEIDPALIKAVIWQESKFLPDARGGAGEIGLMQIREAAALEWAGDEKIHPFDHEQIMHPETNIMCGAYYLAKLLKRYQNTDNPLPYALADYNAGRARVLRWKKGKAQTNSAAFLAGMEYPGTRKYATNVIQRYAHYQEQFRSNGPRRLKI